MRDQIDNFIDSILESVIDTNIHENISDELKDHIAFLIEEKIQSGMNEEDAVRESLLSIGEPKDLGKKFNSLQTLNTIPIFIWGFINIILLTFSIYTITQLSRVLFMDYIIIGIPLIALFIIIKYISTLNRAIKDKIYFTKQKTLKKRTYIENLTNKVLIAGLTLFVLFLLSGTIIQIVHHLDYTLFPQLGIYSNYLFGFIIYTKYPILMLSDRGLYSFVDIPIFIAWNEIDDYKWTKRLGVFRLEVNKNHKLKKIYGNFQTSDRIIIENILEQHQV